MRSTRFQAGRRRARTAILALAAIPLAASQALAVQVTANWIGASGADYGVAANWDIGQVPLNSLATTYSVVIGTNKFVNYRVQNLQTIDEFLLDVGSQFRLSSTSLIVPTGLTVLGRALIAGTITADSASFTALGAGTALLGSTVTLSATNGGVIRIGAPTLSARGLSNSTFLNAAGPGSLLDLPALQTLDSGFNANGGGAVNTVASSNGATINLPAVRTLVAPTNAGSLVFSAVGGSSINLSSLQDVSGVTIDSGSTRFGADNSSFTLGPVRSANRMFVDLQNGSTMSLGGYAGSAAVTNSTFNVAGGSKLNAGALVGTLSARGLSNITLLSAAGVGSLIDMSGLQTIDSGFNANGGGAANGVTAVDRASIKLSGVTTLVAPTSVGSLVFTANGGASIDLSSLQDLAGVTVDSGYTRFNADASSFVLGPMRSANRMIVDLQRGSTMTLGGFAGTAALTNSTFNVAGGSRLNASTLVGTFNVAGVSNTLVLNATGVGSVLDLSGLQAINSGFNANGGGAANSITASNSALLDLSGVQSLVAPTAVGSLSFGVTGGGSIRLSSLQELAGVTIDSGYTRFSADNGSIMLGPLRVANRMVVDLQNGATMTLGGYSGTAAITNSTFNVAGGSRLDGALLVGTYSVKGYSNTTVLNATGAGSVLDLSGLQAIDSNFNANGGGASNFITASNGAVMNLSGVQTLVSPTSVGSLVVAASSGASINLAALQTVNTATGGQVQFNASTGGSLFMHGFTAGPGVRFNLVDAGSQLAVTGNLSLLAGSTMVASTGTRVVFDGSFSFQQKVAAQVDIDAARVAFINGSAATLEVGGKRLSALPAVGAFVNDNFGIGELTVGQSGAASTLVLVDAFDNDNVADSEVLYLNGSAASNGLHILGGSYLVLNGLDLYVTEGGTWVHINDRFTNGITVIPYDQGFIATVPEPGAWGLWLAGLGLIAARRQKARAQASR